MLYTENQLIKNYYVICFKIEKSQIGIRVFGKYISLFLLK